MAAALVSTIFARPADPSVLEQVAIVSATLGHPLPASASWSVPSMGPVLLDVDPRAAANH